MKDEKLQEWLLARRQGITGTDVGKIMGVSKWGTIKDVYEDKVFGKDIPDNENMLWGRLLEPVILGEYARRNNTEYTTTDYIHRGQEEWQLANVDGIAIETPIVLDNGDVVAKWKWGIEIKTSKSSKTFDPKIPPDYEYQCRWYMFVCNLDRWDLAALILGSTYREFTILRDEKIEKEMVSKCRDFWFNYVVPRVQPS